MRRFDDAKKAFAFIARFNGVAYNDDYEFDTEKLKMTSFARSTLVSPIYADLTNEDKINSMVVPSSPD